MQKFLVIWYYFTTFTIGLYAMVGLIIVLGTGLDVDLGGWGPLVFGILRVFVGVGILAMLLRAGVVGKRMANWAVPNPDKPPKTLRSTIAILAPLVFWTAVLFGIWLLSRAFEANWPGPNPS